MRDHHEKVLEANKLQNHIYGDSIVFLIHIHMCVCVMYMRVYKCVHIYTPHISLY